MDAYLIKMLAYGVLGGMAALYIAKLVLQVLGLL